MISKERVEELKRWVEDEIAVHEAMLSSVYAPLCIDGAPGGAGGYYEENISPLRDLLALLDAASLAGQQAGPERVSREWVRFQAGEIWFDETLDDAMDTLIDTLKGFGVEVEPEEGEG